MIKAKFPLWWPENPYPESIFPATAKEIRERINDDMLTTAASGSIGRFAFKATSRRIQRAMVDRLEYAAEVLEERSKEAARASDEVSCYKLAGAAEEFLLLAVEIRGPQEKAILFRMD